MSRADKLLEYTKEKITNDSIRCKGHEFSHILRVYEIGKEIGQKDGANMNVLEPALILHDIIYPADRTEEHATLSANHAKGLLPAFKYSTEEIKQIYIAIASHSRSSNADSAPYSLEAKILYDADKLDGLGELAIQRTKEIFTDLEEGAEWYLNRILDVLKNEPFHTKTGLSLMDEPLQISLKWCKKHLGNEKYQQIMDEYRLEL